MIAMNVGATATRSVQEFSQTGAAAPPTPADISWVITNTAIATVAWNSSTQVATFTGVAAGQTVVTVTDSSNGLTTKDIVSVTTVPPSFTTPTAITITTAPFED